MRKSILRFGALALMSLMSIGAFAENDEGEVIYVGGTSGTTSGSKYVVTKSETTSGTGVVTPGTVKLEKFVTGTAGTVQSPTIIGGAADNNLIVSSSGHKYVCTEISGYNTTVNGRDVWHGAFEGCTDKGITINQTVTTIGKEAFSKMGVAVSITLNPATLTNIGESAFQAKGTETNTVSITNTALNLAPAAERNQLGDYAFAGVKFPSAGTGVEFGAATTIPVGLFQNSTNLKSVLFSSLDKLTEVKKSAFEGCNTIVWFGYLDNNKPVHYIPYTLKTVGDYAFSGAFASNPEFKFSEAFKNVDSKGVPFAEITEVGVQAFNGHPNTWLDEEHFLNLFPAIMESGKIMVLAKGQRSDDVFTYGSQAFAKNIITGTLDFSKRTDETFNNAFNTGRNITKVILPTSTVTIGATAFANCDNIAEFNLTDLSHLNKIESGAFQNVDKFVNVTIPNTVTFIGKDAFTRKNESSNSLAREIKIQPKENIYGGINEISVVINSNEWDNTSEAYVATAPIANYTKTTVYVPMGLRGKYAGTGVIGKYAWSIPAANLYTYGKTLKAYKAAEGETSEVKADVFYNGEYKYEVAKDWDPQYSACKDEAPQVNLIGICTWTNYTTSQEKTSYNSEYNTNKPGENYTAKFSGKVLDLRQTVVRGGENNSDKEFVYYSLVGISDGLFNDPVKPGDAKKFNDYYDLKENVETVNIQADALDLTKKFCGVKVNNEYTGITALKNVFFRAIDTDNTKGWYNTNLSEPKTVKLGDSAFENCSALSTFDIRTVEATNGIVGNNAFMNCVSLKDVVIPDNVEHIGQHAYQKTAIEEVILPENLRNISAYAFAGTKLTEINIPSSVKVIEKYAFDGGSEPVLNELGITVDGKFVGVADVYVNWETAPATAVPDDPETTEVNETVSGIDPLAFGDATSVKCGTQPKYILRSLYTPDGSTYANAPFNDGTKFVISEAIVAKGGKYNGRIDVTLNRGTNYRELNITDESQITEFKITKPAENILVNYTRKVPNSKNMPNPLFVPFAFQGQGEGYQIYKVFDTKIVDNEDGTVSESIEYVKLGEDEYTLPNVPYIFIPTKDEITFQAVGYKATTDQVTLYDKSIVTCSDAAKSFAFYGTYEDTAVKKEWNNGKYALSSGNRFAPLTWRDDDTATKDVDETKHQSVKALRFYMTITPKNDPYASAPANVKVIILDEDEATAIQNVKASSLNAPMFDLMGRQITAPAKGQVYIQNGVKKLAK